MLLSSVIEFKLLIFVFFCALVNSFKFMPIELSSRQLNHSESMSFSYNDSDAFGPSNWKNFNSSCGGSQQSPINIETSTVNHGTASPLYMNYFNKPVIAINISNTGHSIAFRLTFQNARFQPQLIWNGEKIFIFDSLHFHWSNYCSGGSEHTVNGHRYAAEVHLVHFNEKYRYLSAASSQSDGLAVLGVFFELAEEANNDGSNNNKFLKFLNQVRTSGSSALITDMNGIFTVKELIKNRVKEYYSYKGSLTTPPCSESVRWIISKKTMKIYPSELAELSQALAENDSPNLRNFRPLQQLNGRNVYEYNYEHKFDKFLWNII